MGNSTPESWWQAVFTEFDNGAIVNPYGMLLAEALQHYPENSTFRELKERYFPLVTADRNTPEMSLSASDVGHPESLKNRPFMVPHLLVPAIPVAARGGTASFAMSRYPDLLPCVCGRRCLPESREGSPTKHREVLTDSVPSAPTIPTYRW